MLCGSLARTVAVVSTKPKRLIPAFGAESKEAEWWYKNRNVQRKQLLAAVKDGEALVLTQEKLRERLTAANRRPCL